jgi:signal transduction histidine kinase
MNKATTEASNPELPEVNDTSNVVLIVDDNPANLGVLSDFLDEAGFEVLVAQDGESAIAKVAYANPDIILLDIMMPGIDGFETCRRLKANTDTQDIPIVFMSALADTPDKVKGLSLGAVDYITKPFQQEEVLARVRLHLKLRSLTKKLAEQNELLEERVQERTADLNKALDELKQAQVKLIQSEKMSSLGQLVAGIAHEINNPVNFIYGNLVHARDYTHDIVEILKMYRDRYADSDPEIAEKIEDYDLDFLVEDLPKLLQSMQVGADRIRSIVLSLRNFSRMDEAELKYVNVHEGIDSTLMILHNRIKTKPERSGVEIHKEYGEIPQVECYAGQLNQVFMNLITNALDAVEERNKQLTSEEVKANPGYVTVRSWHCEERDRVFVEVIDNGMGISEEIRQKIFEPFYTTKPVGKGTGMGLAICYSIVVEKHGGHLNCHSLPGEGSTFLVEIPVRQSHHDEDNG